MQCPNCSAETTSGNFCTNCGSPLPTSNVVESLKDEALEPDAVEMPEEAAADATSADPFTPPTYDHAPGQAGPTYVPPVGGNAYTSADTAPAYQTSSDGILNQAWDDMIHDPSIVKKAALMGLIELIPVLNFVNMGYGVRWGRRAAFRTGDKLPERLFGDKAFEIGFYSFVIILAWSVVLGIVSALPVVGVIVALAAVPFLMLATGYMAMTEEIGAGFRIADLWEKGKRSFGGLLALTYVPGLVVGIIGSIIISIAGAGIVGASVIGALATYPIVDEAALAGLGLSAILTILILGYVFGVLSVMARLVTYRALGYWMGRMAPEWIQESITKGADPR